MSKSNVHFFKTVRSAAMSEILFEFGMRIKGLNFNPGLPQLQAAREASADRGDGIRQG